MNRIIIDKFINLEGDCLLAASMVTYLSQVNPKYRDYFSKKWLNMLRNHVRIKISGTYDFIKIFGDHIEIKKWLTESLPCDTFSI